MRVSRCAVVIALLAAPLAGCGADGKTSAPPASPAVARVSVPPGTATGFVGARIDVTGLDCEQAGSVWRVTGKVRNPSARPADYRIYTSFLTRESDTRGVLQTDVKGVGPGVERRWSGQLAIPDEGLHCVLRVERTAG
jgi:hypothetical protein